ncbi:MAG: cysteine-rich CWC family protein [Gammaproteobacteria bacterium]|nr:cysteine-rich CWC family protein [Gammaproteobacteria bacterium]MBQ0838353.1 cysteine-rich CWC family protein [Gammaproteobacteria bacterium]
MNKTNCPLCRQANHCGQEKNQTQCWCKAEDIQFPAQLIQQLPADQVGKSCICKACLLAFQAASDSP